MVRHRIATRTMSHGSCRIEERSQSLEDFFRTSCVLFFLCRNNMSLHHSIKCKEVGHSNILISILYPIMGMTNIMSTASTSLSDWIPIQSVHFYKHQSDD